MKIFKNNHNIKVLDKGFISLISYDASDETICQSARISTQNNNKENNIKNDEKLIRYLIRHNHETPFEMSYFKFHIKAPIFVLRQWMRHRICSYNEISGRYSELQNEYYIPEQNRLQKQSTTNKQGSEEELDAWTKNYISHYITKQNNESYEQYKDFLKKGLSRELARLNLPLNIYSEIYWSCNLRSLFHFLKLRMDKYGNSQWEIRQYAKIIYDIIKPIVPISIKAFDDYVLNSKTFSLEEISIIRQFLKDNFFNPNDYDHELTKRELQEFKEKLNLK